MDANKSPGQATALNLAVLALMVLGGCAGESRQDVVAEACTAVEVTQPADDTATVTAGSDPEGNVSTEPSQSAEPPPPALAADALEPLNESLENDARDGVQVQTKEYASAPRYTGNMSSSTPRSWPPTAGPFAQPQSNGMAYSSKPAAVQPFGGSPAPKVKQETQVVLGPGLTLPDPRDVAPRVGDETSRASDQPFVELPIEALVLASPSEEISDAASSSLELEPNSEPQENTASENTASENTASENAASENAASENAASENAASENAASDDTASDDTASDDTASDDTASDGTASVRTAAQKAARVSAVPKSIEVFFATDRLPTSELIPSPLRTFAPAAVVGMISCALFIGFSLTRRFYAMWLLGCGLAVCLGLAVLHTSIIRWQQYSRLASNASTRFSQLRDNEPRDYPLHVGTARVSLPPTHRLASFEQPELLKFEFVETPQKHIVLHSLQVEESSAWFDEISGAACDSPDQAGFIFIHGYNVRFIDALKRTAQLASDLDLHGPAICYSWPSRGEVAAYTADEATVSWSAPHFEQLLVDLHKRTQCRQINVIAHSMGNRALLEAIERIDLRRSALDLQQDTRASDGNLGAGKLIDSLVMAAPDVDMQQFSSRYAKPLRNVAARATLYFSENDRALQLSATIHGSSRLGFDAEKLRSLTGIEPILVDTGDFLSLGHSYYADDPAVVQDLRDLLHGRQPAAQRQLLRSVVTDSGLAYWQLDRGLHAQLPTIRNR